MNNGNLSTFFSFFLSLSLFILFAQSARVHSDCCNIIFFSVRYVVLCCSRCVDVCAALFFLAQAAKTVCEREMQKRMGMEERKKRHKKLNINRFLKWKTWKSYKYVDTVLYGAQIHAHVPSVAERGSDRYFNNNILATDIHSYSVSPYMLYMESWNPKEFTIIAGN